MSEGQKAPKTSDDGSGATPAKKSEIGTILANRYEVLRELGRGGMGVVYLCKDGVTHERVALKRLRPPDEAKATRAEASGPAATSELASAAAVQRSRDARFRSRSSTRRIDSSLHPRCTGQTRRTAKLGSG